MNLYEPEIKFDGGVPLLPNVRPVIILAGTDFDMGFQYSRQLIKVFGVWVLEQFTCRGFTTKEVRALRQLETIIDQYTPELIEFFRGIATGAHTCNVPLSYEHVLASFSGVREFTNGNSSSEGCTGFAAWGDATLEGRLIGAGSKDHKPRPEVTVVFFPRTGNNFIWTPATVMGGSGIGGHPGMNNRGLAYIHHGATCWVNRKPGEWKPGITMPLAVLHTLRNAKDADEAKRMQVNYPDASGFVGGFWVDVGGDGWIIESRDPLTMRKAGDYGERDFLYSTNNALCRELEHYQDPPPEGNRYIEHGGWLGSGATISSTARNLQLWRMLNDYHGRLDLEVVKMMWRFSDGPPSYESLNEADAAYYKSKGRGWRQTIGNLFNTTVGIVQPDDGDGGMYHATWGCPGRIAHPFAPGSHYYIEKQLYSWYEIRLADTPQVTVKTARDRAQYDLYNTYNQLMALTYHDPAYAPLQERFNQAARSWYKGDYFLEQNSGGADETFFLGCALRSFTRAQVLARHVLEALCKPPDRPEDLHLPGYERKK